jgi:hypothetical protein
MLIQLFQWKRCAINRHGGGPASLQNRVLRFNSGRGLQLNPLIFPNNLILVLFRQSGLLPLCYHFYFRALSRAADRARSTIAAASSCIPGMTWL